MTKNISYLLFLFIIFLSCSEYDLERIGFLKVVTVGISDLGTNSVTLVGNTEDLREATVEESGFVLSSSTFDDGLLRVDNSSNLIVRSVQQLKEGGVFLANTTSLESGVTYFYRAFLKIQEESAYAYGAIDSFTTPQLDIVIESIERASAGCPTVANVNLKLLASGIDVSNLEFGIVWRNDVLVEPSLSDNLVMGDQVGADGIASVQLPINDCNSSYSVKAFLQIQANDPILTSKREFSLQEGGIWVELPGVPGVLKRCLPGFGTDKYGYLFCNQQDGTFNIPSFWRFDPINLTWQQQDDPPEDAGRFTPATNDRIFFLGYEFLKDTETWEEILSFKVALQTIQPDNVGFTFNNTVFLEGNGNPVGWLSYNLTTNEIKPIENFPGGGGGVQFLIGNKGYLGMTGSIQDVDYTNFWELDLRTEKWTQIADIPEVFRTLDLVGFSMNGKGYVLSGYDENNLAYLGFWEYDPITDEWKRLTDFGRGDVNAKVGFVINGIAYGGFGETSLIADVERRNEFWKYVPELE